MGGPRRLIDFTTQSEYKSNVERLDAQDRWYLHLKFNYVRVIVNTGVAARLFVVFISTKLIPLTV